MFFSWNKEEKKQKKQNLRQTTFRKTTNIQISQLVKVVSFTTPVEFSIWLIEWSSERFYIQKW